MHGRTRPELAEAEATHRAIALAEMANATGVFRPPVLQLTALSEVIAARDRGRPVFAETCPHYLFLDSSVYDDDGFDTANVSPRPLRKRPTSRGSLARLRTDDLQVVSTDHCPFCLNGQKTVGEHDFSKIPNGGPGIEHRLQLLYSVVQPETAATADVRYSPTTPARLFGLYPRKAPSPSARTPTWLVFDPNGHTTISADTHHMNVDYSLYEGWAAHRSVRTVISAGRAVVEDGLFVRQARPLAGSCVEKRVDCSDGKETKVGTGAMATKDWSWRSGFAAGRGAAKNV